MKEQSQGNKTFDESVERCPPKIISSAGINSFPNVSKTDREEDKKEGTVVFDRMEKALDEPRRISSYRPEEHQKDAIRNNISEKHGYENQEMANKLWKDPTKEHQLQEAQALNLRHSFSWNEEVTVNASEGDAKEQTIN